jgi:hypothetical protein
MLWHGCSFVCGGFVCDGFVWRRKFSDGERGCLLFVDLGEGDDPGWRFVAAAAGGFVQAEGLESAGEGEENQGWSDEDAEIEMQEADAF